MKTCPKCGHFNVQTERKPGGMNKCLDCLHIWPNGMLFADTEKINSSINNHIVVNRRKIKVVPYALAITIEALERDDKVSNICISAEDGEPMICYDYADKYELSINNNHINKSGIRIVDCTNLDNPNE